MNIKNYLEVNVKIVPACDLFITIVAIFRYFLLRISLGVVRSSVLSTAGSAGILVASIVCELLRGPVVLGDSWVIDLDLTAGSVGICVFLYTSAGSAGSFYSHRQLYCWVVLVL